MEDKKEGSQERSRWVSRWQQPESKDQDPWGSQWPNCQPWAGLTLPLHICSRWTACSSCGSQSMGKGLSKKILAVHGYTLPAELPCLVSEREKGSVYRCKDMDCQNVGIKRCSKTSQRWRGWEQGRTVERGNQKSVNEWEVKWIKRNELKCSQNALKFWIEK